MQRAGAADHQQAAPQLQDSARKQSKSPSDLLVLITTDYKGQVLGNESLEQPVKQD